MPKIKRYAILPFTALLLLIGVISAHAQKNNTNPPPNKKDQANQELQEHIKHVRRATLMSLAMPGLGQIYNKKYWKAPIIYGGVAALLYFIDSNNDKYNRYKALYVNVDAPGPAHFYDLDQYQGYSDEQLKEAFKGYMDDFRRWRDLNIIGLAVLYVANVVDAHVDAYFMNYDVNENLSVQVKPAFIRSGQQPRFSQQSPGIALSLNF